MLHMIGAVFVNRNRLPGLSENKISSIFLSRCIEQSVHYCVTDTLATVAAWRSGNIVGHINEVTLCLALLVLGWVTVFGR